MRDTSFSVHTVVIDGERISSDGLSWLELTEGEVIAGGLPVQ